MANFGVDPEVFQKTIDDAKAIYETHKATTLSPGGGMAFFAENANEEEDEVEDEEEPTDFSGLINNQEGEDFEIPSGSDQFQHRTVRGKKRKATDTKMNKQKQQQQQQ